MKHCIILLISILFYGNLSAQADDVTWGPQYKSSGYRTLIGKHENRVYAYRVFINIYLECYNADDMSLIFSRELDLMLQDKKTELHHKETFFINDQIIIIGRHYYKKEKVNKLYGHVLNLDGEEEEGWKELASINATKSDNIGEFNLRLNPDSTKIAVSILQPYNEKADEKLQLILLDQQLEVQSNTEVELDYSDSRTIVYSPLIDKTGNIFILVKVYDEVKVKRSKRRNIEIPYVYYVFEINAESDDVREYEISLDNKNIINIIYGLDLDQKVIVAGMYNDPTKKGGGLSGTFFMRINPQQGEIVQSSTKEFDEKLVSEVIGIKEMQKGGEISKAYMLRRLILTNEGGCLLVAELYFEIKHCSTDSKTGSTSCYYTYHYENILVTHIKADSKIDWHAFIPRESSDRGDGTYTSYALCVNKGKLFFIFHDDKRNYATGERVYKGHKTLVKKGITTLATIDSKGNVNYDLLFENSTNKIYVSPMNSLQTDSNTLMTISKKGRKYKVVKIRF